MINILKQLYHKIQRKLYYEDREVKKLLYTIIQNQERILSNVQLIQDIQLEPKGLNLIPHRLKKVGVLPKYEKFFYGMEANAVCIDGGANQGLFTDLILSLGGEVYAFEPNPLLYSKLLVKYSECNSVHIEQKAIGVLDEMVTFALPDGIESNFLDLSVSSAVKNEKIVKDVITQNSKVFQVPSICLTDYIEKNIFSQNKHVYIVKLDIEGCEFEVLEDIINKEMYKKIGYIFCETHERFVVDGEEKLNRIKESMAQKSITNIFLDWI